MTRAKVMKLGGHPALVVAPMNARALYVFAHGAGAGMRHEFMSEMATALAAEGVATVRWEFPYMAAGKGAPDRPPIAEAAVKAVWDAARTKFDLPMFAGGKSFGGRMTSRAHANLGLDGVQGIAFLGFPLYGAGKPPSVERAEHLALASGPLLFVQGTRDELADLSVLRPVVAGLGTRAELHLIDDADHAFDVRKKAGRTVDVKKEIASVMAAWMMRLAP
ncbi:MAG TPA: alpha/beta family hydrolase [Kofleriaceae bacterium]